jgi:hypothetical protein
MLMPEGPDHDDLAAWTPAQLAQQCAAEQQLFRQRTSSDERYCLELFLRAIRQRDERAWDLVYQQFSGTVLGWLRRHPCANRLQDLDAPDTYITAAFQKLWQATALPSLTTPKFTTLASILAYLRSCLNSIVLDEMRRIDAHPPEVSLEPAINIPAKETSTFSAQELWALIERALPDRRERRLVYLLFVLELKPGDIVRESPQDFPSAKEVYRLTRNVLDRLRRNPALRSWMENGT